MKLLGFEITRQKKTTIPLVSESATSIKPLTIEDWLKNNKSPGVLFYFKIFSDPRLLVCSLYCRHEDNRVDGEGVGYNPEEAFRNALQQIEKTVGTGWRC